MSYFNTIAAIAFFMFQGGKKLMKGLLTLLSVSFSLSFSLFFVFLPAALFQFLLLLWLKYFAIHIQLLLSNSASYILRLSISYEIISRSYTLRLSTSFGTVSKSYILRLSTSFGIISRSYIFRLPSLLV